MKRSIKCLTAVLLLAACAQTPMGPTVPVMPGPNTSFSQFQNDQAVCRNFADQAVRDQAQGANLRGIGTAALTTALGAGLGAAIGGGQGAGIGAAAGALGGTALAARNTSNANASIQTQYRQRFRIMHVQPRQQRAFHGADDQPVAPRRPCDKEAHVAADCFADAP